MNSIPENVEVVTVTQKVGFFKRTTKLEFARKADGTWNQYTGHYDCFDKPFNLDEQDVIDLCNRLFGFSGIKIKMS
jgi:hypothetical protein